MTKKQRLRVLAIMMVALVILPFVMEPEKTLGWLYSGWQSGDSRVNFSAAITKNPELTVWIYDTDKDGAPDGNVNAWRTIYNDSSNDAQSEPEKALIPAGTFGDDTLTVSNQYDLQFGNIMSLAEVYEENCIYARFKITLNENSDSRIYLNYSLPKTDAYYTYLHLYQIAGASSAKVPDDSNLILQLNRIGDADKPFYPFVKAYCSDIVYSAAYTPSSSELKAMFDDSNNYVELDPSGTSLQIKDGDSTTVHNTNNAKKIVYVYMKFEPDVQGISSALKNVKGLTDENTEYNYPSLKGIGPFYAIFDVNLDMEVQLEKTSN